MGRYRLILDRQSNEAYMHRYYLLFKDRVKAAFNLLLHKIVRSDDPVYHDHPWDFTTIVLKGGYWEHTPVLDENNNIIEHVVRWRGPGSIISRKATELHWLELHNNQPAVTLFIPKKRVREWGFLPYNNTINRYEWVLHTEYLVGN